MKFFNRAFLATFVTVSLLGLSGCVIVDANGKNYIGEKSTIKPNGKITSKNYNLKTITSVNLTSMPDVVITQGKNQKVTVKASSNIISYCRLTESNGTLNISLTKEAESKRFKDFDMVIYVTVKNIENVKTSGTGDVKFQGSIKSQNLNLTTSGTGDISLPIFTGESLKVGITGTGDVSIGGRAKIAKLSVSGTGDIDAKLDGLDKLSANVSGTGDVNLKGTALNAEYSVSGTGDIYAKNLIAKRVKAYATGTGDITCYASEAFSGNRSRVASITCYGKPKNRDFHTDGYSFPD